MGVGWRRAGIQRQEAVAVVVVVGEGIAAGQVNERGVTMSSQRVDLEVVHWRDLLLFDGGREDG